MRQKVRIVDDDPIFERKIGFKWLRCVIDKELERREKGQQSID